MSLSLALGVTSSHAGDVIAVSDSVRTAILATEPGWTLADRVVRDGEFRHVWRHQEEIITIFYEELADVAAATAWLDERPLRISLGGGQPVAVGDAALIWTGQLVDGSATIYFRKGRAIATIGAPSATMATRFATMVAGLVR